jgi:hypothetical protein
MSDTPAKKKPPFVVYQHWPEHVHMLPYCRLCGAPVTCASVLVCETPDGQRVQVTICRSHLASAAAMRTDPSVAEIAAHQALNEITIRRLTAVGQRPAVVRLPTVRIPLSTSSNRPAAGQVAPVWRQRLGACWTEIVRCLSWASLAHRDAGQGMAEAGKERA